MLGFVEAVVMGSLTSLPLKLSYRSSRDDIARHFLVPCLEESVLYRRAAGYFTSSGLAHASRGVASLAARGGRMRLVASPHLQADDVAALNKASSNRDEVLRLIAEKSLTAIEDALAKKRLAALSWLAATGLLELRLAYRVNEQGFVASGLFHEKLGIFTDAEGNHVSFSGSANETAGGLVENFESVKVFRSWKDDEGRVNEDIADFESLWGDATAGLRVVDFTAVGSQLLQQYRDPHWKPPSRSSHGGLPDGIELRPYQEQAIKAWSAAGGRGIFAMATGSGKTLTALSLAYRIAAKNRPLMVVVICPFLNLCEQWIGEMGRFGFDPVACYGGRDEWRTQLEIAYQRLLMGDRACESLVVSNATYATEAFQAVLKARVASRAVHHLVIADEVHHLGASGGQASLVEGAPFRLGLSATPERYLDPEGTAAVLSYFGGVVFEYTLAQAVREGRLSNYRYFPVPVTFDDDEAEEYARITKQLARYFRLGGEDSDVPSGAMHLLIRRARLIAGARRKIGALSEVLTAMETLPKAAIFYCGDGTTSEKVGEEDVRQIGAVATLLTDAFGLKIRRFTYRETPAEREEILDGLRSGSLDGVVAVRCLDEGIDLPDLRYGFFLASSTNPRQFVQRRGRLLRKAAGKHEALLYDFCMEPPELGGEMDEVAFNLERRFFAKELRRIDEFCETAENGHLARASLLGLRRKYNLLSH
jgi:superfamily II DNA or RNA helicase